MHLGLPCKPGAPAFTNGTTNGAAWYPLTGKFMYCLLFGINQFVFRIFFNLNVLVLSCLLLCFDCVLCVGCCHCLFCLFVCHALPLSMFTSVCAF